MVETLEIRNFKSIKHLRLACKRINVFIGQPNTGKSNILEAVGVFSFGGYPGDLSSFVRFERTTNLFYDENLDEQVGIRFDSLALEMGPNGGRFEGSWEAGGTKFARLYGGYDDLYFGGPPQRLAPFKFYRFAVQKSFDRPESEFLLPPSGQNLMSVLLAHKELRSTANQLFSPFGLRLGLRPHENTIEVIKQVEDIIISYPYALSSDTLQRLVFYLTAVLSNQDSILAFEEPEAHAFPYHTKHLAEIIALDDRKNQFFISTHNPYFLLPVLEKCPKEEVAVFITYYEDYQTKVKPLSQGDLEEIAEIDVFSNLDRFLEAR